MCEYLHVSYTSDVVNSSRSKGVIVGPELADKVVVVSTNCSHDHLQGV